jgi:hypothetical protein
MGIQSRRSYTNYNSGPTDWKSRMMKTLIGITAFMLICVIYATTHAQPTSGYTTVVIEYVGKSNRPIFPIIISSSNNEAEWYTKKLFGDPISEFAHIDIVKKATLKEISGILSQKVDFTRPIASDRPSMAPTIKLVAAIEDDFKETIIGTEDSVVIVGEIKKHVPRYPLLVGQLSDLEGLLNQYLKKAH